MKYKRPNIEIVQVESFLLTSSEIVGGGPGATDIGAPNVSNECKSVWDEVNETYNINKEEQEDENWN